MYTTIIRLIWPYLARYLTGQAASYLQQRREKQKESLQNQKRPAECPSCPPYLPPNVTPLETVEDETFIDVSSNNGIWFALSGLLIGGTFSVIVYLFVKDQNQ